jgi:hypothetical protein
MQLYHAYERAQYANSYGPRHGLPQAAHSLPLFPSIVSIEL